jgi:hypothetical protein
MERTRSRNTHQGRRIAILATAALLAVGGILYSLADRYLIPHVEALAVTPTASVTSGASVTEAPPERPAP